MKPLFFSCCFRGLFIFSILAVGLVRASAEEPKSEKNVAETMRNLAEQGNTMAQCLLAGMYLRGDNVVPKDYVEAVKWYRKAAEQGLAGAQFSLGDCYDKGVGVQQDMVEAMKWYRKAAEQGSAVATCALSNHYMKGLGVLKNDVEALAWLTVTAVSGDEDIKRIRDTLESKLGPKLTLQAQQRAKDLFKEIESRKSGVKSSPR